MRPDRWRQVEQLYHSALEREESARDAFLREACRQDEELRYEVQSLLDQSQGGMLDHPLQLGPYQIVGVIGAGGMGTVYQARDTRLNRTVAIKVSQARFSARFEREARAVAALNHPNICTLYDVGPNYLVMEYIEGRPLQGPLPLDQALKAAAQIADALDAAHLKGIVHRDLKPGNVLVTKSGVKVLDFGLAKMEEPPPSEEEATRTAKLETEEGTIVGTPQYMAPEQVEGKPADARSDIFAFGCVFYEMLTGARAFDGTSRPSVIAAILAREPRPVHELQPTVPPAVERVLRICLAKDPAERWQSAHDLKAELEWLSGSSGDLAVPAIAPARLWRASRLGWLAAAALACVGAVFGWTHWMAKPQPAPLVRFTVDPPPGLKFYTYSRPSVSPDGERILFNVVEPEQEGGTRTWMYRVSTGESAPFHNLPGRGQLTSPWSPDGNSFAIWAGDDVGNIDLTGTRREVLREQVSDFAWGPSGSYFFGIAGQGLFWVERGSARRQVTVQKPGEGIHELPQPLPDGRSFLFQKRQTATVETWFARLDGKESKLLLTKASQAYFAPPGYLLYLEGGSLFAQRFDPGRGILTGEARVVVSGVAADPGGPYGLFSVSRNGVLAFRQGPVTNPKRLMWLDRSGNAIGTLGEVADYSNPALSPDGRRLAICIRESDRKRNIWILDLAQGTKTCLKFQENDETNPVWSPDGSEIGYSSDRRGHRDLYARSSSGSGQERILLESGEDKTLLDWSADGKFLMYSVLRANPLRELWILPLTGGSRTPVRFNDTPYRQDQAVIAPDSRSVLHTSAETGNLAWEYLYLQYLEPYGGRKWQVTTGAADPQWRGDGREIFYRSNDTLMAADIAADGAPAPPHPLFPLRIRGGARNFFAVSRDGQRFLAVMPAEARDPATTPFVVILNWERLLEDQ